LITVTIHNVAYDEELRLPASGGGLVSIEIEGHAIPGGLFDGEGPDRAHPADKGENIICAAVSYAALNLVRTFRIIAGIDPDYTIENGLMRLSIKTKGIDEKNLPTVSVLLESFIIGMLDLERKYTNLISITIQKTSTKGR
jgi:uncharacterized protein YsxB (DUF464 family)